MFQKRWPSAARPAALFLVAALAALSGCGSDSVDTARGLVERGDLKRARALLVDLDGPEIASLLARIDVLERERAELEREADQIAALAPEAPRREVRAALERLLSEQDDPGAVELIAQRLSHLSDVYAEAAISGRLSRVAVADESERAPSDPESWVPAGDPRSAVPSEGARPMAGTEVRSPPLDPLALLEDDSDAPSPATSIGWERRAAELAVAGDLAGARTAWIEAGALYPPGALRVACLGHARDLADREALRVELALDGESAWLDLSTAELVKRAGSAGVTARARLGLAAELYARGDDARADAEVRRLTRSRDVERSEVWALLARAREEAPPADGYIWWDGTWQRPEQVVLLERAEHVAALAKELVGAKLDRRDAIYTELFDLGELEPLAGAVQERWERAAADVARSKTVAKLEKLADRRAKLDEARAAALALIFDEERYFHPHSVPDVPPDKAAQYPPVQREVSELVAAVDEVWGQQGGVALASGFLESLREIQWARGVQADLGLSLELPEDVPSWVLALPPELEEVDLASFAWTEGEARDLHYSRLVAARNEELWSRPDDAWGPDEMPASSIEQEQVRVTNDYRARMGRRALAWNPRIQAATHDHNVWQNATGTMSHTEDNAEGRSFWDRMQRRGYSNGVSENLAGYGGDAKAPHEAWKRSSGHHRNLLMEGHREMASDSGGRYWTQCFGVGTGFLEELAWLD